MVFNRKIYTKMLEWKNSSIHNSALLIEGARRIGKSTIVEEFAKNEFNDYILVDFRNENNDVKALFNDVKNIDSFFRKFFLSQNHELKPGNLIIFDEIQFCPKARECIKDFVKDGRYYFIETGSLISIKENTQSIMIPSEERRIEMFPMDFEEYLWAVEGNNAFHLLSEYTNGDRVPEDIHKKYLEKFREYLIIGGMPKVVSIFLETNSYYAANDEKLDILNLYNDDLRKHDNKYGTMCQVIFNSISSQLAKDNKRFVINKSFSNKRYSRIEKSLLDLNDFKIVNIVKDVSSLEGPLPLSCKDDRFKLYFCDTGLLFTKLFDITKNNNSKVYLDFIKGSKVANIGSIFESIAVQQLVCNNYTIFYHRYSLLNKETNKNKDFEIDLVFEKDFKINAIEIKSSLNYTTSSLDNLKLKYPQYKINKYVVGVKNGKKENNKITLPIYILLYI